MFSLLNNFTHIEESSTDDDTSDRNRSRYESAPPLYGETVAEEEQEDLPSFTDGQIMETAIGSIATDEQKRHRDDGGGLGLIYQEGSRQEGVVMATAVPAHPTTQNKGPDSKLILGLKIITLRVDMVPVGLSTTNVSNPLLQFRCKSSRGDDGECEIMFNPYWIKTKGMKKDFEFYHNDFKGSTLWKFCNSETWTSGTLNITQDPLRYFTKDSCDIYLDSGPKFEAYAIVQVVLFLVTPVVAFLMMSAFAKGKIKKARLYAVCIGVLCTIQVIIGPIAWSTFANTTLMYGFSPFIQNQDQTTITFVPVMVFLVIGPLSAGMLSGFPFSQKIYEMTRMDMDIFMPIYWPKVIMERWVFEHVPAFDNYPGHCCAETARRLPHLPGSRRY
eukprot:UC4_evm2s67